MKKTIFHNACKVIMVSLGLAVALPLMAADTGQINYQARLLDSYGRRVNGAVDLSFKIYDAAADGNLLWSETQSGVTVQDGVYSVILGSQTAIPASVFAHNAVYLELVINDETMTPRQQITASAYSLVARTIMGSNIYENQTNDYVGIGTTTPAAKLDVNGTVKMTGFKMPTGATPGYILVSDGSGYGTWQSFSVVVTESDPIHTNWVRTVFTPATNDLWTAVDARVLAATYSAATGDLWNAVGLRVLISDYASATGNLWTAVNARVLRSGDIMTGPLTNNILFAGNGAGLTNVPDSGIVSTSYVRKTGDTMTGPLVVSNNVTVIYTNQAGYLIATNSISLQGTVITNWNGLTTILNPYYISSAAGSVTGQNIAVAAITLGKIAIDAVADSNILSAAVTLGKIANNAVADSNILTAAVTLGKIANNAVADSNIINGAVTENKIGQAAVTLGKIANNAVADSNILTAAVTLGKIANSAVADSNIISAAVTLGKIANNAVADSNILSAAVTLGKIANSAVADSNIINGAVTENKIGQAAVTLGKIANNAVADSNIINGAVTENKIGQAAVTLGKIANSAVADSNIINGAVTLGKIANNAVADSNIINASRWNSSAIITEGAAGQGVTIAFSNVYYFAAGSTWSNAIATSSTPAGGLLGIALGSSVANGLLLNGYCTNAWGFTAGSIIYLATNNNQITATRPTGTNHFVRIVGYAVSDTNIYFNPDRTYIEILGE